MLGKVVFLILFVFSIFNSAYGKFTERGINFWSAPDHTRLVIALAGNYRYKSLFKKNPSRIEIIIYGRIKGRIGRTLKINDGVVNYIRVYKRSRSTKVVIFLKRRLKYRVFSLRAFRRRPYRIVVDIFKPESFVKKQRAKRRKRALYYRSKNRFVIVIDPGHGGSDPGAIRYGIREKSLVYDIARRVARYFNRDGRFAAFLTRKGDYYVPLRKRVEIAHDYGADFFISIHCNTAPSRKINGVMAFVLSDRGARTNLVRMLEDIENAEDLAKDIKLSSSRRINRLVLDVAHNFSVTEGEVASKYIVEYVSRFAGMRNMGVRKAAFTVLKNPGIPSLLLEVGFLSNRRDVAKLRSSSYREKIAYGIYKGIKSYFENRYRKIFEKPRYHLVKKGESLWKIAKTYGISVDEIKRANSLKRNTVLKPGMKLVIP